MADTVVVVAGTALLYPGQDVTDADALARSDGGTWDGEDFTPGPATSVEVPLGTVLTLDGSPADGSGTQWGATGGATPVLYGTRRYWVSTSAVRASDAKMVPDHTDEIVNAAISSTTPATSPKAIWWVMVAIVVIIVLSDGG